MQKVRLRSNLEKILGCTIDNDDLVTRYYSVDASAYKIRPGVIVFPKDENQVVQIVRFASKNNVAVTPRGAGTGLVGGALGSQIIMDFKNMNALKINKNSVTVQPGVIKGVLDESLARQKKFFSPNPSIGRYCTVGGMLGTNAGGGHALKYGSVIDNLLEITIVDGRGRKIRLPNNGDIGSRILNIAGQTCGKNYPNVSKNSCGYRLDSVTDIKQTHKVMAGSEGTLGITVSAKFKIRNMPKSKVLSIIAYNSTKNIQNDLIDIKKLGPSAVEYLDRFTINNIGYKFPKSTAASLFVEFDEKPKTKSKRLKKTVVGGRIILSVDKKNEIAKWWNYRNSALAYSIKTVKKERLAPHIIEDSAVPVEKFNELFSLVEKINKKYGTKTIVYGHAGNGNLHVRLVVKKYSEPVLKKITLEFFGEIFKLGGTITAEHGDGLARSEFVKLQYGAKNYRLFKKLKKTLDPKNILNPGKIIADTHTNS